MSEIVIRCKVGDVHVGTVTKQVEGDENAVLQEIIETCGRNAASNRQHKMNFDVDVDGEPRMRDFKYLGDLDEVVLACPRQET